MTDNLRIPTRDPSISRRIFSFQLPSSGTDSVGFLQTILRGPRGLFAYAPTAKQPEQDLVLFGLEHDPKTRRVRDVLAELDLRYFYRPCAAGSAGAKALAEYGAATTFPMLIDPNHDERIEGDEAAIDYLWEVWADRPRPHAGAALKRVDRALSEFGSSSVPKVLSLSTAVREREPLAQPLELWNIEASPYCRKVRTALDRLDLPTTVINICKLSKRRPEMRERFGRVQVPLLVDPNTGVEMIESDEIVRYLDQTYGS